MIINGLDTPTAAIARYHAMRRADKRRQMCHQGGLPRRAWSALAERLAAVAAAAWLDDWGMAQQVLAARLSAQHRAHGALPIRRFGYEPRGERQ